MHQNLIEMLRRKLEKKNSEELLQLWIENDRERWSPEAFEAARRVLVERGVPILEQNPPLVTIRRHGLSPDTEYWMSWLRPVLYLAIVLNVLSFIRGGMRPAIGFTPQFVAELMLDVGVPALMVLSAIGCIKLYASARQAMLVCAWIAIASRVLYTLRTFPLYWSAWATLGRLEREIYHIAFLLMLIGLLTREPIRELFAPKVKGFEPQLLS